MTIDYADFRADIGDANEVFSEPDIDRLETRAIDRWGADAAYEGARVMAVQQLLANAAKFSDYTANESQQKKSQIFKNLQSLLKVYQADLYEVLEDAAGASVRMGRGRIRPPRRKEWPDA